MAGSRVGFMLVGDWVKAHAIIKATPKELDRAIPKALWAEGLYAAAEIKKYIRTSIPPANAASTILQKGSSKTLQDKLDMLNAITPIKSAKNKVYVGIARSAARGTVRIARVHEEGRTIVQVMTPKQRKYLHAKLGGTGGSKGGGGTGTGVIIIHIPARPFIRPTFERLREGYEERFLGRVLQYLTIGTKKKP